MVQALVILLGRFPTLTETVLVAPEGGETCQNDHGVGEKSPWE